jgi:hypothetical protein
MNFSSLLSSWSLLYAVGGGVCVVFIIVFILVKILNPKQSSQVQTFNLAEVAVSTALPSQALTKEGSILPSTNVMDIAPVVIANNAASASVEINKGEIPPLSSWKPNQEAVSFKSEDGVDTTLDTQVGSLESSTQA